MYKVYVLNLGREAKHTDFLKQNRDYITTFTHKHKYLPWKPLIGRNQQTLEPHLLFSHYHYESLTIQNIGIQQHLMPQSINPDYKIDSNQLSRIKLHVFTKLPKIAKNNKKNWLACAHAGNCLMVISE